MAAGGELERFGCCGVDVGLRVVLSWGDDELGMRDVKEANEDVPSQLQPVGS